MFKKFLTGCLIGIALIVFICSCSDVSDNGGQNKKDIIAALKEACDNRKTIALVVPIDGDSGWKHGYSIVFSDGSSIEILENIGDACGCPFLTIDPENFWVVSYDYGKTFSRIVGAAGTPVSAIVDKALAVDDIRIDVSIDENDSYYFELYSSASPSVVLETIAAFGRFDSANILQSIVVDSNSGVVDLTMADGVCFRYDYQVFYPASIVLLTDTVEMGIHTPGEFEFRVNPSNARIDCSFDGDTPGLQLDRIEGISKMSSYVTSPVDYKIIRVERSLTETGEIKQGQYKVVIEDRREEVNAGYSDKVALVLNTKNERNELVQLSSSIMTVNYGLGTNISSLKIGDVEAVETAEGIFYIKLPYGTDVSALSPVIATNASRILLRRDESDMSADMVDLSRPATLVAVSSCGETREYKVVVHYSALPIVYVDTPMPIVSKDEWTEDCSIQIWNAGEYNMEYANVNIKGRGNTTWSAPKKPYAIKLDKKASVLGMPEHKRWVLLANYFDPSGLRNEIAFHIGRISSLVYTPRTDFVEIVFNGRYEGFYQITEQLKIDANRVNVGDDGFLLEIDARATGDDIFFWIPTIEQPIVIKDPDIEPNGADYDYIRDYLIRVSDVLFSDDWLDVEMGYKNYLNLESFVDWYLINEITKNNDACFFSSCYMNMQRGGKLNMGPLWDYDLAFGNVSYNNNDVPEGFWIKTKVLWYQRLFEDPEFVSCVKERFLYFYQNRDFFTDRIFAYGKNFSYPMFGNNLRWHNLTDADFPIDDVYQAYDCSLEAVDDWLNARWEWLRNEYEKM